MRSRNLRKIVHSRTRQRERRRRLLLGRGVLIAATALGATAFLLYSIGVPGSPEPLDNDGSVHFYAPAPRMLTPSRSAPVRSTSRKLQLSRFAPRRFAFTSDALLNEAPLKSAYSSHPVPLEKSSLHVKPHVGLH
jgi:hypothetical protein